MALVMVALAGIGGVTSGINDASTGNKLRKGICATNKQIASVSATYKKLLAAEQAELAQLKQDFMNNLQQLHSEKEILKTLRTNYAQTKRAMIIASIIFILSIASGFGWKALMPKT